MRVKLCRANIHFVGKFATLTIMSSAWNFEDQCPSPVDIVSNRKDMPTVLWPQKYTTL